MPTTEMVFVAVPALDRRPLIIPTSKPLSLFGSATGAGTGFAAASALAGQSNALAPTRGTTSRLVLSVAGMALGAGTGVAATTVSVEHNKAPVCIVGTTSEVLFAGTAMGAGTSIAAVLLVLVTAISCCDVFSKGSYSPRAPTVGMEFVVVPALDNPQLQFHRGPAKLIADCRICSGSGYRRSCYKCWCWLQ